MLAVNEHVSETMLFFRESLTAIERKASMLSCILYIFSERPSLLRISKLAILVVLCLGLLIGSAMQCGTLGWRRWGHDQKGAIDATGVASFSKEIP
jgi:hypothetical protein